MKEVRQQSDWQEREKAGLSRLETFGCLLKSSVFASEKIGLLAFSKWKFCNSAKKVCCTEDFFAPQIFSRGLVSALAFSSYKRRRHKHQPTFSPYLCSNPSHLPREPPSTERFASKPKQATAQIDPCALKAVCFSKLFDGV